MGLKIIQAFNEVGELREAPPVLLGREVQYPRRHQAFVEVGSPQADFTAVHAVQVVSVHVWKLPTELERDPLTHHANAIHGVNPSLTPGLEQIAYENLNYHC
jgi:hypothetical protein